MAVSNCASLMGLELDYRIEVLGHIGDCPHPVTPGNPTYNPNEVLPGIGQHNKQSGSGEASLSVNSVSDSHVCAIEGELNSTLQWFGYIANVSLQKGGGFRFRFSYPTSKYAQNVLLYGLDNVMKLRPQQVSLLLC